MQIQLYHSALWRDEYWRAFKYQQSWSMKNIFVSPIMFAQCFLSFQTRLCQIKYPLKGFQPARPVIQWINMEIFRRGRSTFLAECILAVYESCQLTGLLEYSILGRASPRLKKAQFLQGQYKYFRFAYSENHEIPAMFHKNTKCNLLFLILGEIFRGESIPLGGSNFIKNEYVSEALLRAIRGPQRTF